MTASTVLHKLPTPYFEEVAGRFQHILKEDVTLDAEPYSTIPAGTPIFGEEINGWVVFQFGEYKRQIPKSHFETV